MTSPRKPKHAGGRPPKKPEDRRVMLAPQRVRPDTKLWLEANAKRFGGIGKLLDRLKEAAGESL